MDVGHCRPQACLKEGLHPSECLQPSRCLIMMLVQVGHVMSCCSALRCALAVYPSSLFSFTARREAVRSKRLSGILQQPPSRLPDESAAELLPSYEDICAQLASPNAAAASEKERIVWVKWPRSPAWPVRRDLCLVR